MSIEFNIDASYAWHMGEEKEIVIRVLDENGAPVDLSTLQLRWCVARTAYSFAPYIELFTPDDITVEAHEDDPYDVMSVARMHVSPEHYTMRRFGIYRHELRDNLSSLVLSQGPAVILPAMVPAES